MVQSSTTLENEDISYLALAAGYLAACISASLCFSVLLLIHGLVQPLDASSSQSEGALVLILPVAAFAPAFIILFLFALPGFALLRLALYLLGRNDATSFAICGAILGWLALLCIGAKGSWDLFGRIPSTLAVCLIGAIAGAVACRTELRATTKGRLERAGVPNREPLQ